jgi:hypothetical protein
MSQTLQEKNKALVLEAFDPRTISSIVLILSRAAKVCSISSEAFHPL